MDIFILLFKDDFDPATDEPNQKGKATVIIGLMQEHRRAGRVDGLKELSINMKLYRVRVRDPRLT